MVDRRRLPDGLHAQAANCQTTRLIPSVPSSSSTTNGIVNATASTSCVLSCSTMQLVCHTSCARQSPSQQRLPGPRLGAERVQARAAIVASIGSSAVSGRPCRRRSPPRCDGNRACRCDRCGRVMCTSGGSPASRTRVRRSCMMLNASIITTPLPVRSLTAHGLYALRAPVALRRCWLSSSDRGRCGRPRGAACFRIWGNALAKSTCPWCLSASIRPGFSAARYPIK